MKIKFTNVGRNDANWTAEMDTFDHKELVKEVKRHSVVLSNDIEFLIDDDHKYGEIIVGGFRCIGTFEVIGNEVPA